MTTKQTAKEVAAIIGRKDENCEAVKLAMSYGHVIGVVTGTAKYMGAVKMASVRKIYPNAKALHCVAFGWKQGNDTIAVY